MNLNDILVQVRALVQDTSEPQRYSDTILVGFANQALKRIAVLRPDLFSYITDLACIEDSVIQKLPADSIRFIGAYSVKGGNALHETNKEILDQITPGWVSEPAGEARSFMRHIRNPNMFFIYPKAPADQILTVEYAKTPIEYTKDQDVELLSDAYAPVVIDATVFLVQSVDNEHVLSNRAQLFYSSFTGALKASLDIRGVTDRKFSGTSEEGPV